MLTGNKWKLATIQYLQVKRLSLLMCVYANACMWVTGSARNYEKGKSNRKTDQFFITCVNHLRLKSHAWSLLRVKKNCVNGRLRLWNLLTGLLGPLFVETPKRFGRTHGVHFQWSLRFLIYSLAGCNTLFPIHWRWVRAKRLAFQRMLIMDLIARWLCFITITSPPVRVCVHLRVLTITLSM